MIWLLEISLRVLELLLLMVATAAESLGDLVVWDGNSSCC